MKIIVYALANGWLITTEDTAMMDAETTYVAVDSQELGQIIERLSKGKV